jgi:hypothetical protein
MLAYWKAGGGLGDTNRLILPRPHPLQAPFTTSPDYQERRRRRNEERNTVGLYSTVE